MKNFIEQQKQDQYRDVTGSSGGKSGGGGGSESADTLVTNEMVKILNLLGEGEVNLYTGDGQSIFLNNVPLMNSDGTYNFGNYNETTEANNLLFYYGAGTTYYEYRNGAPSQTAMTNPAFPSASQIYTVNQAVTGGTSSPVVAPSPVSYSVTSALINYVKIEISFPNGIANVDSKGNIIGDTVNFAVDVKPHSSGSWVEVLNQTINAKSDNAAIVQYQINNPSVGNLWDLRVRRITQDNSSATRKNQTFLDTVEEVQQITLSYNGIAYCGLALDAATIGGDDTSIPQMSFAVTKGPIAIPSNFNPASNTFSGVWNGTFTTGITDDPVWVLYDMITNPQYGLVLYGRITAAMVDIYSFYNASVFNNVQVPNGLGGFVTQPRFTFNACIQNRQDVYATLNQVAAVCNSVLSWDGGLLKLLQDRPTSSMYLITKSNVIGSDASKPSYFKYSSTASTDRTTVVNVTYTDGTDPQFLPTTCSVSDAAGLSRYQYQPYDLAAFGATTEGQALRAGRYYLYQALYNTQQVEFTTGPEGFKYQLYDVFDLFDDDYADTAVGGRVVSATTSTITFDQPITITGTTSKVSVWLQDGVTYETHNISNSAGTYTNVSIAGTWSVTPTQYCTYGVTSAVSPRQFRLVDLKYDGVAKTVDVTAALYSQNNYSYVETGVVVASPVYSLPENLQPSPPTDVAAIGTQYIDAVDGALDHGVSLSWDRPSAQNVSYMIKWRKDNGAYTQTAQFAANAWTMSPIVQGVYDFLVYSVNVAGNYSAPATCSYTLDTSGGGSTSALADVTGLYVLGTTGVTWTGEDLSISWINPLGNQGLLKDFLVTFKNSAGTFLRSVVVDNVNGGAAQGYVYTWAMNQADGGPNRAVVIEVQCRDAYNDLTTGATATFTNPAPAVPLNIAASPVQQSCIITWTPETGTDVAGYIVWYSTTSGFTPSSANAIDCGMTAIAALPSLIKNTQYYFILACYDVFGKSLSGTGLNLSSQLSFTTPSNIGIASGSTLPTSGMLDGDAFYDTANKTLYTYNGATATWLPVGVVSVASLPASGTSGQVILLTTTNVLYQWNGSSWTAISVPAGSVTGQLTAAQIASITAAQLTGTLTTTQIGPNTIQTGNLASGSVTTAVLAAGAVTAATIAASTITGTQIAGGTITGSLIAANTINTSNLVAGAITAATIAAGAVTTSALAAGAVTAATIASGTITTNQIAAGTITASNMNVATLSAISANIGTVTAGLISNSSGTNTINLSATGSTNFISTPQFWVNGTGNAYFGGNLGAGTVTASTISVTTLSSISANLGAVTAGTITMSSASSYIQWTNGTYMKVTGVGFGNASQFIEWYGPVVSSASNFAACTAANALFYLTVSGGAYFGGNTGGSSSGISGLNGWVKLAPNSAGTVIIEQWGSYTQTASSPNTVPFVITFPHNCMNVGVTPSGGNESYWVGPITTTGFQLNFGAASQTVMWRAIGY
jgi:predicted phage tail protein